jgi:DNA invertase Pin-like site-specific DNA recombinase
VDLLAIIRLSDFRETSGSPEQQRKAEADYAASHGHRIIAFVEDTDVSGDFGPFHPKRSIGPWLTDRQNEYDGIICRAINRVARNAEQMLRLLRWAENRGKVLISIKDGIDTTTDAGKTYVFGNRVAGSGLHRAYLGKRESDHRTSE